jgi:hypothetical protein
MRTCSPGVMCHSHMITSRSDPRTLILDAPSGRTRLNLAEDPAGFRPRPGAPRGSRVCRRVAVREASETRTYRSRRHRCRVLRLRRDQGGTPAHRRRPPTDVDRLRAVRRLLRHRASRSRLCWGSVPRRSLRGPLSGSPRVGLATRRAGRRVRTRSGYRGRGARRRRERLAWRRPDAPRARSPRPP